MYDFLRRVPLFAEMSEDDLARLCEMVEEVHLPAGQDLFKEGSKGDRAYVITGGQIEILKESSGRQVLVSVRAAGDVIGEMALLEDAPRSATVRARTDSELLAIHQEQMEQLLKSSASAAQAMLHTVLGRWRATSSALRQSEKMAQLGTFTAGIAHELNNPAAAVRRGIGQLQDVIGDYSQAQAALSRLVLTSPQQAMLDDLAQDARTLAARPLMLDAVERSDLESELESWLDDQGVADAWELAPTLVSLGYHAAKLTGWEEVFTPDVMPEVIRWLGATYTVHNLMAEVSLGAERISAIVKALKSYSYLDQAPVQQVDLHEGLDSTLLILRSKLKDLKVKRDYAQDLPKITGYGSELNQVWTNLIDNAADAVASTPNPTITLQTRREGDWISVTVEDNGPGIPADVQRRVFEPFYTTKPPGKGTGLGLDISYNIVVNKHRGEIKLFSQPGRTRFQVVLPVNFESADTGPTMITPLANTTDEHLRHILETIHTIAVVGISSNPDRPAHSVPAYLQAHGYRIIPVNPNLEELLGEKAYPDLLTVPEPVDVVLIFRPGDEVMPFVEQAIQIKAKVVWMQETIVNEAAADVARQAGLDVVMDTCMRATYRRLFGKKPA